MPWLCIVGLQQCLSHDVPTSTSAVAAIKAGLMITLKCVEAGCEVAAIISLQLSRATPICIASAWAPCTATPCSPCPPCTAPACPPYTAPPASPTQHPVPPCTACWLTAVTAPAVRLVLVDQLVVSLIVSLMQWAPVHFQSAVVQKCSSIIARGKPKFALFCPVAVPVVIYQDTLLAVSLLAMTLVPAQLQQSLVHLCMHICFGPEDAQGIAHSAYRVSSALHYVFVRYFGCHMQFTARSHRLNEGCCLLQCATLALYSHAARHAIK